MTSASQEQISQFIEATPAFAGLPDQARAGLAASGELKEIPADGLIFSRGETGDSLFFVVSGEVRITLQLPRGDEEVSQLKPGDFFGEIALMTQSKRTATVAAVVDATVLEFPAASIAPLLAQFPEFKACIARTGAQRSREALEKMIEE